MDPLLSRLIVVVLLVLAARWVWQRLTQKGKELRTWAQNLRPKERAARQQTGGPSRPAPAPSKVAGAVGAGAGGLAEGAVLAWKAGWPGFLLGWDRGRSRVNDWWMNRKTPPSAPPQDDPPAGTDSAELDLTRCPECGYDLASHSWPKRHKDPATSKPCDYDWPTDDRWVPCPTCGELYPPGIDKCGDCGRRVAAGPTRFDPDEPDEPASPPPPPEPEEEPSTSGEQPAPPTTATEGTTDMAVTETGPAEIRTIADLRAAAAANHRQAQADLEDTTAAVTRAQVAAKYAAAIADAASTILDRDPAAAAAQTEQLEAAVADVRAAQARRASAEARLNAAMAALRALQAHRAMEEAAAATGGRASSRTEAYAPQ